MHSSQVTAKNCYGMYSLEVYGPRTVLGKICVQLQSGTPYSRENRLSDSPTSKFKFKTGACPNLDMRPYASAVGVTVMESPLWFLRLERQQAVVKKESLDKSYL